jgi:hypothetical protein
LVKSLPRDTRVAQLRNNHNVAQFISFNDDLTARICVLRKASSSTSNPEMLLSALFEGALNQRVNVRIFKPATSTGAALFINVNSVEGVIAILTAQRAIGGYSIVSETIDVDDGGVAGVLYGDVVEFTQGSTPKFVDQQRSGIFPQMRREAAERMLRTVYGSDVNFSRFAPDERVEFSTHPGDCGTQPGKFLIWDCYQVTPQKQVIPRLIWPNSFSEWMGDKCFGLLAAWSSGFLVPKVVAFLHPLLSRDDDGSNPRWTPPNGLLFGDETDSAGTWTRTCPIRPVPGRYPTYNFRSDPLELMLRIDPEGEVIRSCLVQQDVGAEYSGAAQMWHDGVRIEGVKGQGARLMKGTQSPQQLPTFVEQSIQKLSEDIKSVYGLCRFEWAWQNHRAWLLQINQIQGQSQSMTALGTIRQGYLKFDPDLGLAELDRIISLAKLQDRDVLVTKQVGLTSHVCELLNQSQLHFAIMGSGA